MWDQYVQKALGVKFASVTHKYELIRYCIIHANTLSPLVKLKKEGEKWVIHRTGSVLRWKYPNKWTDWYCTRYTGRKARQEPHPLDLGET